MRFGLFNQKRQILKFKVLRAIETPLLQTCFQTDNQNTSATDAKKYEKKANFWGGGPGLIFTQR